MKERELGAVLSADIISSMVTEDIDWFIAQLSDGKNTK